MEDVPLGRQALRVSFIGYETITIPNVVVTSGKTASFDVALVESYMALDEVVVTPTTSKSRTINKLTTVSARQFSLDEVTRFSGGRSDVARLASNFAGVSSPDDSRNDIVVRGNSPTGMLWASRRYTHTESQPLFHPGNDWQPCFCAKPKPFEEL